ncbi:hypothetical protein EXU85_01595 [Spirosoma sp. KCTC 42546]|uniref:hypothetical protein n=1 Tax=Spirosoma sp. KCTC 42546 TaxID=2520506 RepID=UPI00115922FF|nr:hypothetical protein [Spirosoma sp. KCTC 42546]QDK77356.1 hypothetical protein EXU85_01595 [Spirosoma sp. KCTC 42546]
MATRYLFLGLLFLTTTSFAQIANDNTLKAQIDGKEFITQPRRIKIANFWWVTANTIKPDKSLRIWLGRFDKSDVLESGTYLVVDADKPDTKENKKKYEDMGKYKGIAVIKYVEETKEPRMEYHVGKSTNADETIQVKLGTDGFLEATFGGTLAGSYWKEKASATVFGGMGRLMNKMQDKAITKASGYDQDIDPEGNGYKKQEKEDQIVISNGTFRLKMN